MHRTARLRTRLFVSLAATSMVLTLASCGKDAAAPDTTPASVTLSPAGSINLQSGATQIVTATVKNKAGEVLSDATVSWVSTASTIASVSTSGSVTGALVGTAQIGASAGTVASSMLNVTVTPGSAAKLVMKTQPGGALSGSDLSPQPEVVLQDAAGNQTSSAATVTVDIGSGGGTLSGTTSIAASSGVATFSGVQVRGIPGNRTLTFSSAGLSSVTSAAFAVALDPVLTSIDIDQISPATVFIGATLQLTATGANLDGVDLDPAFTWESGDAAIASVDANGLVTGVALGSTEIVAKSGAVTSESITINVTDGTLATTLEFGGDAKIINIGVAGSTAKPTVEAMDAGNQVIIGASVTFQSRSSAVATVAADGTITGAGAGAAFVVATAEGGASDSVYIQVLPATGPVLYANLTKMVWHEGETVTMTVKLDMRGATLGAATFMVNWPDDFWLGILDFVQAVDGASALGTQTLVAANGQVRASALSQNGVANVVDLLEVTFTARNFVGPRSGFITLLPQDIVDISLQSITSSVTALRYPIVVLP